MATAGPTIVAKFLADTSKMTGEVDKATNTAGSKMSSFAKGAVAAIGGAFVVDKIVDFGKASVEAAGADAKAQGILAAALKNTTGATDAQVAGAEKFISNLSKSAAIADDDLRPALGTLARGFKDTNKAQDALSLATDVAAGTGKDLKTVTDAMARAAMGNTGALGRLGVATKDSSGKALSLDQIMANMSKTFKGQAAVAAESTAGKMRASEIAMGELQETIGTELLPVIATLATFLTGTLLPAFTAVFGWIMDNKGVVIAAIIGIGAVLMPMFIQWAAGAAAAAAATLVAAAPFIAIAAVIAGVAYVIIRNWGTIVKVTRAAWNAVLGAVKAVWAWIRRNWPLLLAVITGPIGTAVVLVVRNWDTIKRAVMAVWNWIRQNWPKLLAVITGPIGTAVYLVIRNWNSIKTAVSGVISWINTAWRRLTAIITTPIASAVHTVAVLFGQMRNAATELYNWVAGKFRAIASAISGAVGSISGAISRVASAIKSPINAVISTWNRLQFTVPSVQLPSFAGLTVLGKTVIPGWTGPRIGGYSVGFPDLPYLASGAVLSSPTLFVGGEAGRELVTPEGLLRQIISEEGGATFVLNMYPRHADANDVAYGFRRLELLAGVR